MSSVSITFPCGHCGRACIFSDGGTANNSKILLFLLKCGIPGPARQSSGRGNTTARKETSFNEVLQYTPDQEGIWRGVSANEAHGNSRSFVGISRPGWKIRGSCRIHSWKLNPLAELLSGLPLWIGPGQRWTKIISGHPYTQWVIKFGLKKIKFKP